MNILEIKNLNKSFSSKEVIKDVSFNVKEHSIFGFIGKNGAGKTTTMKMILGLMKIDSGEIYVNNELVKYGENNTNKYIGYLPDVPEFYGFMKPSEYLEMCGQICGMKKEEIKNKSNELLELVGLSNENKKIKSFSRGMKQRLGIAQALLNSPKLLICDEPTSALDPIGRKEVLDILYSIKEYTTVIFSTHILSDVERICDTIALLHDGKIVLNDNIENIKKIRKEDKIEIEFINEIDRDKFIKDYPNSNKLSNIKVILNSNNIIEIMKYLSNNNILINKIERLEETLEDLFIKVVGNETN